MSFRRRLSGPVNAIFERVLDVQLINAGARGHHLMRELKRYLGPTDRVLDIGANRGQFARQLHRAFPEASIDCFEPHPKEYEHLVKTCRQIGGTAHRLAFGREPGNATLYFGPGTTAHSLLPLSENSKEGVACEVATLDQWVGEKSVDVLKVDTEGFDLEVLRGGDSMISLGRVRSIIVEVGFDPEIERFVPFEDVRSWLAERGYVTLGIYDQCIIDRLIYANACFINS